MIIAAHAIAWEPLCPLLCQVMKFPTFPTYKISIPLLLFVVCFGESCLNPITKVGDFSDNPLSSNVFICFWKWILENILYFQSFILFSRCSFQTVSPFIRFLPKPLHKWNIVHTYLKIPFPRISMCSGRSQSTAIAFPHKGSSINFVMFFKIIKESKVSWY